MAVIAQNIVETAHPEQRAILHLENVLMVALEAGMESHAKTVSDRMLFVIA